VDTLPGLSLLGLRILGIPRDIKNLAKLRDLVCFKGKHLFHWIAYKKCNILDTLVVKYLLGMPPQCLMEVQKPPPSPHLGHPRAEGTCSMDADQRSCGVFWAMTQGPMLHINPEIGTKITIKLDKPCIRKHLMS
jgi:hypothetical protein